MEKLEGTMEQKARALGTSSPTLYSYLNGKTLPNTDFLLRAKETLRINIDWLLTGDDKNVDVAYFANIDIERFLIIASRFNKFIKDNNIPDKIITLRFRDEILLKIYNSLAYIDEGIPEIITKTDYLLDLSLSYINKQGIDYDDANYNRTDYD